MNEEQQSPGEAELTPGHAVLFTAGGAIAFQLAYSIHALGCLIVVYLWCVFQLTRVRSARQASYFGLAVGMLAYAPQSLFLWKIFGPAAIALWFVLAFWLRMFVILGRSCRLQFGRAGAALLIPFLWTGLEFFRSECYYLRFSWYNAGYVFSDNLQWLPMKWPGMYGIGFALMAIIGVLSLVSFRKRLIIEAVFLTALGLLSNLPPPNPSHIQSGRNLLVAGVQLEFPSDIEVTDSLDKLIKQYPQAQLLVLSEYTVDGPVPAGIKAWCRKHERYLVIGGKDPATNGDFYDTAFVVGPDGQIVFRQGKSVPVQFFKDGLPAREQKVWESPWGRLGFCICYDLSYTRVTDGLIRQGAEAIIVPTMDVVEWGRHQHELHARVARIRAAEYGVPIFRLASSGISQCVDRNGRETANAPMPGDGATIDGTLNLNGPGHLPWDRAIAPLSVWITGGFIVWLGMRWCLKKRFCSRHAQDISTTDARRNPGIVSEG